MTSLKKYYTNTSPIVKFLAFTIVSCVLFAFFLSFTGSERNALSYMKGFFVHHFLVGTDSWGAMIGAIEHIKKFPDQHVYDTLFENGVKFQYPLSSLLIFDVISSLTGASYIGIAYWLDRISAASVFLFGFVSANILIEVLKSLRKNSLEHSTKVEKVLIYCFVLILTFLFYPILKSYFLGQIQTLITLLTAVALYCWQINKKTLSGVVLGFICLIKPQLGLLFLWGAIRKQWKMVIPGLTVVAIFTLISIYVYGFAENLYYLKVLSFLSQRGESYMANQSMNGFLNRLLFNGENLKWDGKFPDFNPLVYYPTLITSLTLMALGLLRRWKVKHPSVIEFSLMVLCATMASPIAWEHHYAIIFTIFLLIMPYMYTFYKNKKYVLAIYVFSYLIISQHLEFVYQYADTRLNFLESHLFFGACIMLFFLLKVSLKYEKTEMNNLPG